MISDMWEALIKRPRGRVSLRNLLLSLATVLVACFIYIGASSPVVHAAADATWNGDDITFSGDTYTGPIDRTNLRGLKGIPDGASVYQFIEKISDYQVAHIIYFPSGAAPKSEKEAYYTTYTFNPPGTYKDPSGKSTISITPVANDPLANANTSSECTVDGVGWIVCSVSNWIADGMDMIYTVVAGFLTVNPITNNNASLYASWGFMRNIANLAFIIAFLVIIYYHLVGTVDAKFALRKIIPRIVLVAILVNVSYWIVAVGVDISNIMGYSIQEMFNGLRNSLGAANTDAAAQIGWKSITALILSGGAAGYAAFSGLGAATAFSGTSMSLLLFAALIPALFALFVAFAILAVRQALITIFIIISPLAFVAYLLPNTEEWFNRWRKLFMSLLIMFPAFSVIFGGAQLAGIIIIQNAPKSLLGVAIVLLGLMVQTVPLFITPFLIRLSSGLMGTIAGMVNNRGKGLFDRTKNWADDRRDYHKARAMSQAGPNASMRRRAGAHYGMKKHHRERMKSAYMGQAEALYERSGRGQRAYRESRFGEEQKEYSKNYNEELYQRRIAGDVDPSQRTRRERMFQGQADAQDQRFAEHRNMLHESHAAGVRAGILKDAVHEEGERHVREQINTAAPGTYSARVRGAQQQAIVDKGVADLYKGRVEAIGEQDFREEVAGSRALTRVVQDTHHAKKQAEAYETIVQKAAERSWSNRVTHDADTQELYLRARRFEKGAEAADKDLEAFVNRTATFGEEAKGLVAGNEAVANSLRDLTLEVAAREQGLENIKDEQRTKLLSKLSDDQRLRTIAGGDTKYGETKVMAKNQDAVTRAYLENVKAQTSIYSNEGYRVDEMFRAAQDHFLRGNEPADEIAQHAAVQYVMESIGNNWSVQKLMDWADTQGMEMATDANGDTITDAHGEPIYYDGVAYRAAVRNGTVGQLKALDKDEVSRRRDLLQMVVGGYRNGKNKVSYAANTILERMNRGLTSSQYSEQMGRDLSFSESAILSEARQGKYEPERFATADPDEISRMVQVFRNPAYRELLSEQQRGKILESIVLAQTSEQTRTRIKPRERGLMNSLAAYLELPNGAAPALDDRRQMESVYYEQEHDDGSGNKFWVRVPASMASQPGVREMQASTMAPNVYDYTRQDDIRPSGLGQIPPRGKDDDDMPGGRSFFEPR